jgi:hypothetical protein
VGACRETKTNGAAALDRMVDCAHGMQALVFEIVWSFDHAFWICAKRSLDDQVRFFPISQKTWSALPVTRLADDLLGWHQGAGNENEGMLRNKLQEAESRLMEKVYACVFVYVRTCGCASRR